MTTLTELILGLVLLYLLLQSRWAELIFTVGLALLAWVIVAGKEILQANGWWEEA